MFGLFGKKGKEVNVDLQMHVETGNLVLIATAMAAGITPKQLFDKVSDIKAIEAFNNEMLSLSIDKLSKELQEELKSKSKSKDSKNK